MIYLVRHGESFANIDPVFYLRMPNRLVELTSKGEEQSHAVGSVLKNNIKDMHRLHIISSPYKRTVQTSKIISGYFSNNTETNYSTNILIAEHNYGAAEGHKRLAEYCKLFPEEGNKYERFGPIYYRPPGGESVLDVYVRVSIFYEQYIKHNTDYTFIVVGHKNSLIALERCIIRKQPEDSPFDEMMWKNCECHQIDNNLNSRIIQ